MIDLYIDRLPTEIGELFIIADRSVLLAVVFPEAEDKTRTKLEKQLGAVRWIETLDPLAATSTLGAYFCGDVDLIASLPVGALGTPFQHRVWDALRKIPTGVTTSYGQIARSIGFPTACRAVGMANGRNPIAIVVPCHRVIGANATLTGYAGGLERKEWLLNHERRNTNKHSSLSGLKIGEDSSQTFFDMLATNRV